MTGRPKSQSSFAALLNGGAIGHGVERARLDGRHPRLLGDEPRALLVVSGYVDLFAVSIEGSAPVGSRYQLCRIETGGIIFGFPFAKPAAQEQPVGVLAVGGQGTEALLFDRKLIDDFEAIENWIARLCSAIAGAPAGWGAREAQPGAAMTLEAGDQIRGLAQGVVWVAIDSGEIALMGSNGVCRAGDPIFPFASGTWAEARAETRVRVVDSAMAAADVWPAMDRFHELAMGYIGARIAAAADAELDRLDQRSQQAAIRNTELLSELVEVLGPARVHRNRTEGADPLLEVCQLVAEAGGTHVRAPPDRTAGQGSLSEAAAIAQSSGLRSRLVLLRGEWWRRDNGPLIAWRSDQGEAVAIVPLAPGRYVMIKPGDFVRRPVDAAIAAELAPEALMFYAPLALEGGAAKLFGFCLRKCHREVLRILISALAVGIFGLAAPLITEVLIDSIIPRTEFDQLAYCAAALAFVAIGIAGFQVIQNVGALRLEGVLNRTLQAGVIDRLLRLPVSFFRQYPVGDLTDRVLGMDAIWRIVTGRTIRGLLAGVFTLISFGLMFYFDVGLALTAVGLTVLRGAIIVLSSIARLKHERRHSQLDGIAQGLVLQFITGVGKLRVAVATDRALAVWGRKFAAQKKQFVASRRIATLLGVFEAAFPTFATLAIFAGAWRSASQLTLDTGQFLAFFAAFGQALAGGGQLAAAIGELLIAVPRLDRLRPLIDEPVEIARHGGQPEELAGAIELRRVTFRYAPDGPLILSNVTLQVAKGEYLAVVGPSGSGKSTLFRLLLGFEKAESGTVFFDGKAIDTLDITTVRRQIGVVLQNGKLASGSLYENICCGVQLPLDRAWEAARQAGLDSDIEAMPMGMHTVIAEGTNTLSGGQRQRLMIARALVLRPRILLFDEATSALDNKTQAIVSESLANLNVTRIVVAQRLSTVKSAGRIIVLAGGEIVQSGSFEELSAAPGMFADFAQRQLL
jgi:NHLM bacteriocin system ABC transporter ATP-binding protein